MDVRRKMANLRALDYHLTMMSSHFFGVVFTFLGDVTWTFRAALAVVNIR